MTFAVIGKSTDEDFSAGQKLLQRLFFIGTTGAMVGV
jgi:hypothetical protein